MAITDLGSAQNEFAALVADDPQFSRMFLIEGGSVEIDPRVSDEELASMLHAVSVAYNPPRFSTRREPPTR